MKYRVQQIDESIELLQAARHDPLAQLKEDCRNDPNPSFQTFGPRTRREFLRLQNPDGLPV